MIMTFLSFIYIIMNFAQMMNIFLKAFHLLFWIGNIKKKILSYFCLLYTSLISMNHYNYDKFFVYSYKISESQEEYEIQPSIFQ